MTAEKLHNPHIIAPALYGGAWTNDLDSVLHWTWIEHWETERERRKAREWRRAIARGTTLAEESALFTLTMKARQVAELDRHRAKLVHWLKTRAWDLAARQVPPGHA